MQKIIKLALVLTLFVSQSTFANDWSSLVGCYKTLTLNGQTVNSGPDAKLSQSKISRDGYAEEFTALDGSEMPSINFNLFQCYNCPDFPPNSYSFVSESFFIHAGYRNRNQWSFSGEVYSLPWDGKTLLDVAIEYKKNTDGTLTVKTERRSTVAGPNYDRDYTWLLKPTTCLE